MTICVESSVEVDNFQIRAARIYLRCQLWGLVLKFWPSSCNCWEVLQPLNYDVLHVRYHIVYQIVKRVRGGGGWGGLISGGGVTGELPLANFRRDHFRTDVPFHANFRATKCLLYAVLYMAHHNSFPTTISNIFQIKTARNTVHMSGP